MTRPRPRRSLSPLPTSATTFWLSSSANRAPTQYKLLFPHPLRHNTDARSRAVIDGACCFSAVLRRLRCSAPLWPIAFFIIIVISVSTLSHPQPGYAQDTQGSNPPSSSLRGTVINSVTREPVARALVYSQDNRFAAFTDDQGHFEFEVPRIESN